MSDPAATGFIGRSVLRREDHRLLRGRGVFVGDLQLPGMLHAAIVRSDHAHARIVGIDTSAAAALPGVVAVVTGDDVVKALGPVPEQQVALPNRWAEDEGDDELASPELHGESVGGREGTGQGYDWGGLVRESAYTFAQIAVNVSDLVCGHRPPHNGTGWKLRETTTEVVRLAGVEPATLGLEVPMLNCTIDLCLHDYSSC